MKKQYICFLISAIISLNCIIPVAFASDNMTTVTTEYEAALEQSRSFKKQRNVGGGDPLVEFKKAFTERAALPEETLRGYGYSEKEISVLKDYLDGDISFESAASRASAVLTATLTNSKHTSTQYICKYSWSWDKTPTGLGEDAFALAMSGINANSMAFETKKMSSSASVTYWYTDNSVYKTETPSVSTSGQSAECTFDSYKMSSNGNRWVWAKSGYITLSISPAVSGNAAFASARAYGEYAHSTVSSGSLDVSVTIGLGGGITVSFSHSKGNAKRILCGKKQILFYVNGTTHNES